MHRLPSLGLTLALCLCAWIPDATAQNEDLLVIRTSDNKERMLRGEITDYTGTQVTINLNTGRQDAFPAERVVRLSTKYTSDHLQGDELKAARNFAAAVDAYRRALRSEPRLWVRRQLMAKFVVCYSNTGQFASAGDSFRFLYRSDPSTPFMNCIPLCWQTHQPNAALEQRALAWLAIDDETIAQLLGASWLLTTRHRNQAVTALRRLENDRVPEIARLAEAQLWRTEIVTAEADQVAHWERKTNQLPGLLRSGPAFILGRAYMRQKKYESALLAFMRGPALTPDLSFAAESLLSAGMACEKLQRPGQARQLYQEVAQRYGSTLAGQEAQQRIQLPTPAER